MSDVLNINNPIIQTYKLYERIIINLRYAPENSTKIVRSRLRWSQILNTCRHHICENGAVGWESHSQNPQHRWGQSTVMGRWLHNSLPLILANSHRISSIPVHTSQYLDVTYSTPIHSKERENNTLSNNPKTTMSKSRSRKKSLDYPPKYNTKAQETLPLL
jgi:hypothetical protein